MAVRRVSNEIPTMSDRDKNKMFTCPYNKYHRITALIYPSHVANCRKQYTGSSFARCPFNARHEFPACEYDYHVSTCPDKNIIEKELTTASAPNVPEVNHFPEWNQITPTEDWDSEANHVAFSIAGNANVEQERNAYDVMEDFQDELEERALQQEQRNAGQMTGLSKAQKKNLKRAQKRREKRAVENGHDGGNDDDDDDDDDGDSNELTEQEKMNKLAQLTWEYTNRQYSAEAFVDWVSILNQYCQKNRINQPKYSEASNPHGGFGAAVVVTTERFFSDQYCNTKKDAKHSAARAALLGLNIAVSLPDPCRAPHVGGGNVERARELEQRRALIESRMTQSQQPRVIPGFNPTTSQASAARSSTQSAQITRQMGAVSLDRQSEDEWQLASGRRRDVGRGSGKNSLRLAGIGRGRARK